MPVFLVKILSSALESKCSAKVAPNEYLTFQRNVLSNQKTRIKVVNRTILDNEIDKLDITTQQKSDIKSNIKLRTVTLGKSRRTEENDRR